MKRKITQFLHWRKYTWQDTEIYEYCSSDMTDQGPEWVMIRKDELEIEIPDDFDPRPGQVAALRHERINILAVSQAKLDNIDEQIQRLLCLEHKPETKL